MTAAEAGGHFSLVSTGPFYRLARRSRLSPEQHSRVRMSMALVAVTWLPLVALALVDWALHGRFPNILRDLSVHARLLVQIPFLLHSEISLEERSRDVIDRFRKDRLAGRPELLQPAVERAQRLFGSWLVELVLFLAAFVLGPAALMRWFGPGPLATGLIQAERYAANTWYMLICVPISNFLLFRALWRWAIWNYLLWRMSRMDLHPLPTHPDRAGGLAFLTMPIISFVWMAAAINMVFCMGWLTQVLLGGAIATAFRNALIALVVLEVALAYLPLLVFSHLLYRAQWHWLLEHGHLAAEMTKEFQERWILKPPKENLLDAGDASIMIDYTSTYEVLASMRLVPFTWKGLVRFIVIIALPALPVALTFTPLVEILRKLPHLLLT